MAMIDVKPYLRLDILSIALSPDFTQLCPYARLSRLSALASACAPRLTDEASQIGARLGERTHTVARCRRSLQHQHGVTYCLRIPHRISHVSKRSAHASMCVWRAVQPLCLRVDGCNAQASSAAVSFQAHTPTDGHL
eukprot:6198631-Pleurochrysis_carterae.AAC.1